MINTKEKRISKPTNSDSIVSELKTNKPTTVSKTEKVTEKPTKNVSEKLKELDVYEKEIKDSKKEILQKIVLNALYSLKLPTFVPHSTKVIKLSELPNFSSTTVGQLLGKEGKRRSEFINITKVNLQLTEPTNADAIVLAKYNPVDVEKAVRLIEKLLANKVNDWSTKAMQEKYDDVTKEFDEECISNGSQILSSYLQYTEYSDNLSKMVGLLKYTWSYNQNILDHSFAVADLTANIAVQLGMDKLAAKRAGFFHDIGKSISDYQDHVEIGVKIAQDEKLEDYVINTIACHHGGAVKPNNPYALIVKAMDKISAGWPGERPMQKTFVNARTTKITTELQEIDWIEKTVLKQSGNLIIIFIKPEKFDFEKINEMKLELKEKLKNIKTHYEYNYHIEMKLVYENNFLINDIET